jgi:hypothetical protein
MDEIPADERPSTPSKDELLRDIKVLPLSPPPPFPHTHTNTHTHTHTHLVYAPSLPPPPSLLRAAQRFALYFG